MMIMTDLGIVLVAIAVFTTFTMGIKICASHLHAKTERPKIQMIQKTVQRKLKEDDLDDWQICQLQNIAKNFKDKLNCKNITS